MKDDRLSDDEALELLGKFSGDDDDEAIDGDDGSDFAGSGDDEDDDSPLDQQEPDSDAEEETEEEAEEETEEEAEDETPDAPKEEEKPTPPPTKDDNPLVPRARLNKEIEKRRAAEERIRQLEAAVQQPVVQQVAKQNVDIDKAKVAEALNKVLDGEIDGAAEALAAVMAQLSPTQQTTVTPDQIAQAVQAELEAGKLREYAEVVLSQNAWLDDTNEDHFDADAAEEVIALRDTYIQRGMKLTDALEKAVRVTAKEYGYFKEAPAVDTKQPEATAKPKLKPAQVDKKLELAKKAPKRVPETADRSQQRERASLATLNDDDFDKMSVDALRRARGDIV